MFYNVLTAAGKNLKTLAVKRNRGDARRDKTGYNLTTPTLELRILDIRDLVNQKVQLGIAVFFIGFRNFSFILINRDPKEKAFNPGTG